MTTSISSRLLDAFQRHFILLSAAVLVLAAVNAFVRLGSEFVTEWDEALYALSAWELLQHGNWIAPTLHGQVDYYNSKPPLNIWLIALSFKAFGVNVVSLRLVSAAAAWLTVVSLWWFAWRTFGKAVALMAAVVLSTTFGFLYVHSGRTANPDALNALLVLWTVIALWAAQTNRWRLVWIGPILAATFLLRGAAVLMPLAIVVAALAISRRRTQPGAGRMVPLAAAAVLFVVPVGLWALARWRFDRWAFFAQMFGYDFVNRSFDPLEGHAGSPVYYLWVLQRYQFDWLVAAIAVWALSGRERPTWAALRDAWHSWPAKLLICWGGLTLAIPTLMATKASWYLNPFYPVFAVCLGLLLVHGLSAVAANGTRARGAIVVAIVVATVGIAEARLAWRSWQDRDWRHSVQALLRDEAEALLGKRVYRARWTRAERFVLQALVGANPVEARDWNASVEQSGKDDFFVSSDPSLRDDRLSPVRTFNEYTLYRRVSCDRAAVEEKGDCRH